MMFLEIGLVDPSENGMQVLISGHRGDTGSVLIEALSSAGCACFAHGLDPFPKRLNRVVHATAHHPGAEANNMLVSNVAYLQEVPASTSMQLYSIDALTQNSDFAHSHPRYTLGHWLQRRRKAKSS